MNAPAPQHTSDLDLIGRILDERNWPEISYFERTSFRQMREWVAATPYRTLSLKQRAWAHEVWQRLRPIDVAKVPRGREVATPAVLRNLPKKPPGRTG